MPLIRIQREDFDTSAIISELIKGRRDIGAIVTFTGLVRDLPKRALRSMLLEHYPLMTEKAIASIIDKAMQRWNISEAAVVHRIGELQPVDHIVLVVTISAHRKDAFDANEYIMDYLKTHAPFWKKEVTDSGEYWVDAKDSDDEALARWN